LLIASVASGQTGHFIVDISFSLHGKQWRRQRARSDRSVRSVGES
jgi:hypothetical protein